MMNDVKVNPKILCILHLPPPVHGAAMMGKYVKDSQLINKQFECDFINLSTSESLGDIGKGGIKKFVSLLKLLLKVVNALFKKKYHLCYVTLSARGSGYYKDFFIVLVLKLFRKKIIYHFHNKGVEANRTKGMNDLFYQYTFNNVKCILLSPYLYSDISHYVKKRDVFFCPNGVPQDAIENNILLREEPSHSVCRMLFLSNMMVEKGVYVLMEACKLIKEQNIAFECHFVGELSEISKGDLSKMILDNDLTGHIFIHGKKIGQDKFWYYENSELFILPTYSECFPLVLLEAMQFGLPVISTFEGGIPDIVVDSVTGFLVSKKNTQELADKIMILINNKELRAQMGMAGKKRYKEMFTIQQFEENLASIFKHTILNA